MTKLIWYSFPSNHSGHLNLLYLGPDNEIGHECIDNDRQYGYFILGGPALYWEDDELTKAGQTLLAGFPPGFHVYPKGCEEKVTSSLQKWLALQPKKELNRWEDQLQVFTDTLLSYEQCATMYLAHTPPEGRIVFLYGEDGRGHDEFFAHLAERFFQLPKTERNHLGLVRDWRLPDFG